MKQLTNYAEIHNMKSYPLRIGPVLKEQLKKLAEYNDISLNKQIEIILTDYMDKQRKA